MKPKRVLRRLLGLAGLEVYRVRRSRVFAWLPDGPVTALSPAGGFFYQPCIHPGGESVVYHGNLRGAPRVWATHLVTGRTAPLTDERASAVHPSYSWDGSRLVFASDRAWGDAALDVSDQRRGAMRGARLNLYTADEDGSDSRQITFGEGLDRRPCFRPDGRAVAFLSNRSGRPDLWVTELGGDGLPRCLEVDRQEWAPGRPWYAADGSHLFFYGRPRAAGRDRICRIPAEGGRVETLAEDDRGDSHGPFVDWDGRALLMHSTRGGRFNIWEIALHGGAPQPLFPPGFDLALHATRSRNGIVAFDVPWRGPLRVGLGLRARAGRRPAPRLDGAAGRPGP